MQEAPAPAAQGSGGGGITELIVQTDSGLGKIAAAVEKVGLPQEIGAMLTQARELLSQAVDAMEAAAGGGGGPQPQPEASQMRSAEQGASNARPMGA